jgi:hypothetical protein
MTGSVTVWTIGVYRIYESYLLLRCRKKIIVQFSLYYLLCSLHGVHEMNTYRADHVCLSVRMIQLENCWTDFAEIWCRLYAIGGYHKIFLFNFLQSLLSTWRTHELVRWERHDQDSIAQPSAHESNALPRR